MVPQHEAVVLAQGDGKALWFLGSLTTVKVSGEQTSNEYALLEDVSPPGYGPPPHIHHAEDEAFYLLEGEMSVFCGERTWRVTPGAFVFLPRGIVHGFHIEGSTPARKLVIVTPAGFERFVEEMAEPAQELTLPPPAPPDMDKLRAVAAKYQIDVLIPSPAEPGRP